MISGSREQLREELPEHHHRASRAHVEALQRAQRRTGSIPTMYADMANSAGLLDTYIRGYDHFREESGLSLPEQEVVFLTISAYHHCRYCVAAHSMIAQQMSKVPSAVLEALRQGKPLPDRKLQALSTFTRLMTDSRGQPTPQELQTFLDAGYTERHVLAVILAIAIKTLSNYSNHLFTLSRTRPLPPSAGPDRRPPERRDRTCLGCPR